jgi:hypothetical protein
MRTKSRPLLILAAALLLALASGVRAQSQEPTIDFSRETSAAAEQFSRVLRGIDPPPPPPVIGESEAGVAGAPGVDVVVNNPALDTPDSTTQSETALAVAGSIICAGYNDAGAGGYSGFSRSTDLGDTWTDSGGIGGGGDPVIAAHIASGTFYYAHLASIGGVSAIGVAKSTDGCQSFGAAVNATPGSSAAAHLQDKPWIAVDNTGGANDGNIYVCWTRFVNNNPGPATSGETRVSRSIDGGATFVNDQLVSGPTEFFPIGCSIDVGPGGEVNVAWEARGGGLPVRFRRSTDGGVTFPAAPVQINTNPVRHPGVDRVVTCELPRPTLNGDIRMLSQVWLAADATGGPYDGNLYAVWAHDPLGGLDNSDVYFSRSSDGGASWSPEVQVGGGTVTDQFEPFVKVGGAGTVTIAWYDRRNDPANNLNIDVYATFSRDGGATIDPIMRITDVSFGVPPLLGQPTGSGQFDPGFRACYMGEYIAVASDEDNFYYAWGDNRNTVVSANYPAGRPDPDVFFDARPAPPKRGVGGVAELSRLNEPPRAGADAGAARYRAVYAGLAVAVLLMLTLPAWLALGRRS